MALIPPGLIVDGPRSERHCYGLLTGLQSLTEPTDLHWKAGLQVPSWICTDLETTLLDCPPVTGEKGFERGIDYCESDPFVVFSSFQCPPVGLTAEQFYRIVQNRYDANIERTLENTLWTGATDAGSVNPSFAFGNPSCGITPVDLTPVGGPLSPVAALGVLESALAACWPGPGTIHMSFGAVPFFAANQLLERVEDETRTFASENVITAAPNYGTVNGSGLRTFSCNRVIAGSGYPGTGPANVAPDTGATWIFGTSQIVGWRGEAFFNPPNFPEGVDRNLNDATIRLETEWAFSFVCCLFAVQVELCANECV